jgi:aminotransferase EvaB
MLLPADPKAEFLSFAPQIRAAIERVLTSGHYILGPEVEAFESEFSRYLGGGQVIGVANGTEAIELALRAAGVGPGDRVATVANTVTATVSAIEQIGARPVFVEIDPATLVMSLPALQAVLARTVVKAVIPVHLYGHPADMPGIMALCRAAGVVVIEDCAQSHGARVGGRHAGTWGDYAAFSFYPTKNLGALGDGGAVVASQPEGAERIRRFRQYGWRQRYIAESPGRNSRLDELQAAILRVKLPSLDVLNTQRRVLAAAYQDRLSGLPVLLPATAEGVEPVYHQYVIRTDRRDALREALLPQGITCGVLYPVPIHRQPAYADPALSLPESERACAEVLCLPCHPGITLADVETVARAIRAFFVR